MGLGVWRLEAKEDCLFAGHLAEGFLGASFLRLDPTKPTCWCLGVDLAQWKRFSVEHAAQSRRQGDAAERAMTVHDRCCLPRGSVAPCRELLCQLAMIKIHKHIAALQDDPMYCQSFRPEPAAPPTRAAPSRACTALSHVTERCALRRGVLRHLITTCDPPKRYVRRFR